MPVIHTETRAEWLVTFCLLSDGAEEVAVSADACYGHYSGDDREEWEGLLAHFRAYNTSFRTYHAHGGPGAGSRMTHAMSGRTT